MKIGGRPIGAGAPAFILGEVASAHQGEAGKAIALAKSAQAAGAEGVKFQLFRADALVAPNDPNRATFDEIELAIADWGRVLAEAKTLGVPVFADIFDRESLDLGEKMDVVAYKIHSTDMENPAFIRAVAATGKSALFLRNSSMARSTSPSVSMSAFLQSIMPSPVRSLSSFTSAAVMAISLLLDLAIGLG